MTMATIGSHALSLEADLKVKCVNTVPEFASKPARESCVTLQALQNEATTAIKENRLFNNELHRI